MKMKKACEATALTERAIRLYIAKGLIIPRQKDGLIDFSPEDIQHLRDIALLRQLDFSMEQIAGMLGNAEDIPHILASRLEAARASAEHEKEVVALLTSLAPEGCTSLHGVADGIRTNRVTPALNFTQFDEITDEARQLESMASSKAVNRQQKRQRLLHMLGRTAFVIVAVLVVVLVFLSSTRIEGYISVAPLTVVEVQGERATFRIGNEDAVEVLGRDTITVPYAADGFHPVQLDVFPGSRLASGAVSETNSQLAVELTNADLLRLGINPLQNFSPRSVQRHNEWMTFILHMMFADGVSDDCALWIRYPANVRPLLWVEE